MKKLMMILAACASIAAYAELSAVEIHAGTNAVPTPAKGVLLHAVSTNASGTVTLTKLTTLALAWNETRTVTNVTYTTAWSNLTHVVTNDYVTAWRTNLVSSIITNGVTNIVVATNFIDRAVNAVPSVYPWPDLLITTNKVPVVEVYTNVPYQVEASRTILTLDTPRTFTKYVTNDICTVTLSAGFKTNAVNCVLAPGETVIGSGTAFEGGRIQLIFER